MAVVVRLLRTLLDMLPEAQNLAIVAGRHHRRVRPFWGNLLLICHPCALVVETSLDVRVACSPSHYSSLSLLNYMMSRNAIGQCPNRKAEPPTSTLSTLSLQPPQLSFQAFSPIATAPARQ